MNLTPEQEEVVSISAGRHLVLAPPGSGKTEMLSQRILRALNRGVDPKRMLCATFTNRAAFEMRDRVGKSGGKNLPDVGNLHHFCYRFLVSIGKMRPGRHVLDEVEQLEFIKEVVDILRNELYGGARFPAGHRGVSVMSLIGASANESRRKHLSELMEGYFADCFRRGESPYPDILAGALVVHQSRIGIPSRFRRPMPPPMYGFSKEGLLMAIAIAYTGLKRRFRSVDFDDLVNETYLRLENHPLPEEKKFLWVQIDEVQDLNPMQWRIVANLTSSSAVSVYFGDVEQAIFSFLGASSVSFEDATAGCVRHYFRTNFRATPLLLEVMMRYSIAALASDWEFLPAPACCNGSADPPSPTRLALAPKVSERSVAAHAFRLLSSGIAENVAILVRGNFEADVYEAVVKPLGLRFAKVSGLDLFSYAPMRDFLAYASLFNDSTAMNDWAALFRRFSRGISSRAAARYFVRDMFASGWEPMSLFEEGGVRGVFRTWKNRATVFSIMHSIKLMSIRKALLRPYRSTVVKSFRTIFDSFATAAFSGERRYSLHELLPGAVISDSMRGDPEVYERAVAHAKERIERFLRYTDRVYADDKRDFRRALAEDWDMIRKLKEADLLIGDEQIVISTIHKAKGRQFDAVVVPDVIRVLKCRDIQEREELKRLLYVAMSRARRHLSLFGCDQSMPEISCIAKCFNPGYVSYYHRRDAGLAEDDWLWTWERLAAMNARCECDLPVVDDALRRGNPAVRRMALKCCRHMSDPVLRRRRLLDFAAASGATDAVCVKTAVDCLGQCGIFDAETSGIVRSVALGTDSFSLANAAFLYMQKAAGAGAAQVIPAIGDFLYSRFPELRFSAATSLFDLGDARWCGNIAGSTRDFEYLAAAEDPEHENSIREILRGRLPSGYESRLRNVLRSRAMKNRLPLTAA